MIFFSSCFCSPHLVYQQNLGTQPFSNPEVLLAFFPRLLSQRTGARPSEDTFVLHLEQCKWFFAAVWCAFLFLGASSWVIWEKHPLKPWWMIPHSIHWLIIFPMNMARTGR